LPCRPENRRFEPELVSIWPVGSVTGTAARSDARACTGMLKEVFCARTSAFHSLPESRIAYWASSTVRRVFATLASLGTGLAIPQFGVSTKYDFRFLRLLWEIPARTITTERDKCKSHIQNDVYNWAPFAKGGEYAPYYGDVHLAIDWTQEGGRIAQYVTERYPYLKGNVGWIAPRPSCVSGPLARPWPDGWTTTERANAAPNEIWAWCIDLPALRCLLPRPSLPQPWPYAPTRLTCLSRKRHPGRTKQFGQLDGDVGSHGNPRPLPTPR